jgi:hypothetical protein
MRHTISQGSQALSAILLRIAAEAPAMRPVVVLTGWRAVEEAKHADA